MKNIAIFASGSGTNAQRIAEYFQSHKEVKVCRIYCNNPQAYVIQRAVNLGIPLTLFTRKELHESSMVLKTLKDDNTNLIVLAGFLWLIPEDIIHAYKGSIINIHPALLPKYGGKGMYGARVHETVISNNDDVSGITIHFVNEHYDEGQIIFKATCKVEPEDTPDSLAVKIHQLEYEHYPAIIEKLLLK